jgi:hypothetical protein
LITRKTSDFAGNGSEFADLFPERIAYTVAPEHPRSRRAAGGSVRVTSAYAPRAATKRTWEHFAFVPTRDIVPSHRSVDAPHHRYGLPFDWRLGDVRS